MSPVSSDLAVKYTIQVNLTDSMGASNNYSFSVKVIDTYEEIDMNEDNSISIDKSLTVQEKNIKAKIIIKRVTR
jgi:hypothetical protein